MRRSDLWWATLPQTVGSGPGGRRPVLIIQADRFTQSRIRTVIVMVITSNLSLADAPGNAFLPQGESGLDQDSVANVSQVITVDKTLLTELIGTLPPSLMQKVESGLKLALSLAS